MCYVILVECTPWGAVLAGRVQVLLQSLIVVNLCGNWNGHGLAIVTTVTRRVIRRPAKRERKKWERMRQRAERTKEEGKKKERKK